MKILFFASTDDCLGGAKSLLELVEQLKKNGVEVVVVNPFSNKLNMKLNQLGIENYSAGYHLNICKQDHTGLKFILKFIVKYIRYSICQLRGKYYIDKKIDFTDIDIIHSNNSVEDIGVYFANKYKKPHIWHLREFGKEDFNFVYFHKNIGKYISDNCTASIAISNAVKESWVGKGVDTNKVVTICHGVQSESFSILLEKEKHEKIKIVFVGAIIEAKGQFEFIKALASMNKKYRNMFELDLFGTVEESYKEELQNYILENNLSEIVYFRGYRNNINEILSEYDIGVVNSKCEAMGRVTVEYMMSGLCVLASNRGANPELLDNGSYGYLYEYGNIKSIIEVLEYIAVNREECRAMGLKAQKYAMSQLSIEKNVSKYIELYRRCINESKI